MAEMHTDAAALAQEAIYFDRVCRELKAQVAQVAETVASLVAHLRGEPGIAAHNALARFQEAAARQMHLHSDILTTAQQAASPYSKPDDEPLSPQMDLLALKGSKDMTGHEWDFAAIEGAASAIPGHATIIDALLDEGTSSLSKLSAAWGGSGSEAYQQVQRRWDATASDLHGSLQDLSRTLAAASSAERGVTDRFS